MEIPIWVWILNIVGVGAIAWFLSWRLKSKLAEVEDRHVMSGIRHRKRIDESEQKSKSVGKKIVVDISALDPSSLLTLLSIYSKAGFTQARV